MERDSLGVAAGELGWARLNRAESNDASASLRAAEALRRASDPDQPGVRLEAHRLLGEVALDAGRTDLAVTESTRAIALAESCELPYERALAQLLLSEVYLAANRRSEAAALLGEAMTILLTLEARPALQRAEVLAARAGMHPSGLARSTDLTERELEVLRLIVSGRSNQAIADDLFISWTTARTHVSNIFRKLDVSSRAEAVDIAHRRGLSAPETPTGIDHDAARIVSLSAVPKSCERTIFIGDRPSNSNSSTNSYAFVRAIKSRTEVHDDSHIRGSGSGSLAPSI